MQKHRLDGDYAMEEPGEPPALVSDVVVFIRGPEPEYVFDAVSGKELTTRVVGEGVEISLPAFDYLACVVVNYDKFGVEELAELGLHWLEENLTRASERIVGWWKFDERSGAVASAGRLNDGHWHHVAMTVEFETSDSNDTVKLYIDANENGGSTNARNTNKRDDSDYIIMVGRIDAVIDDVRIYNYVLDANEIGRLHEGFSPEDKLICSQYPDEDMNRDCRIDFLDFAVLANHWLGSPKQHIFREQTVSLSQP